MTSPYGLPMGNHPLDVHPVRALIVAMFESLEQEMSYGLAFTMCRRYVCIYNYIRTYLFGVYMYIYIYIYIFTYLHTYIHTYIHTYKLYSNVSSNISPPSHHPLLNGDFP